MCRAREEWKQALTTGGDWACEGRQGGVGREVGRDDGSSCADIQLDVGASVDVGGQGIVAAADSVRLEAVNGD